MTQNVIVDADQPLNILQSQIVWVGKECESPAVLSSKQFEDQQVIKQPRMMPELPSWTFHLTETTIPCGNKSKYTPQGGEQNAKPVATMQDGMGTRERGPRRARASKLVANARRTPQAPNPKFLVHQPT